MLYLHSTRLFVGSILQTGLVLCAPCNCVVGETAETICTLTSDTLTENLLTSGRWVFSNCATTSSWLAEGVVAVREGASGAARADVDCPGVCAVEVGGLGWLIWEREVALALIDELLLVLVGCVDDGLEQMLVAIGKCFEMFEHT